MAKAKKHKSKGIKPDQLKDKLSLLFDETSHKSRNILIYVVSMLLLSRLLIALVYLLYTQITRDNRTLAEALCIFDAGWYRQMVETPGIYQLEPNDNGEANWAFFPILPLLVKGIGNVTKLDPYIIGVVLNTILIGIAGYVVFRYIQRTRGDSLQAALFIALTMLGPYTYIYSSLYTEALFVLLAALALDMLDRRRYLLMGVCGALLSATRNTGVLFCFAVAAHAFQHYVSENKKGQRSFAGLFSYVFRQPKLICGTLMIPVGLIAFMAYLYARIGDPLAFVHIQTAWGRNPTNPFRVLLSGLTSGVNFYYLMWAIWGIACLVTLYRRRRFPEAAFGTMLLWAPLSTILYSMPRYMVGGYVFMLGFVEWLTLTRRRHRNTITMVVLIGSVLFSLILTFLWFRQDWRLA